MFDIEKELKKLPAKPGVYIMHDKNDKIIYVGKAISLKNRVRQFYLVHGFFQILFEICLCFSTCNRKIVV